MTAELAKSAETILVIEDDQGTRHLLTRMLTHQGYTILTASDGKEGLEKALAEEPDLVLLDLNLPHMSGLEVLQALQEQECDIPVILMTVFGSEDVIVQALRSGMRDYLSKPLLLEDLLKATERALAAQRWARQKEQLARQEAALKAMEQLIVTVAHYVNNPLMALMLELDSLNTRLQTQYDLDQDPALRRALALIETKIDEIATVIDILRQVDSLPTAPYAGKIRMLDIEQKLRQRLQQEEQPAVPPVPDLRATP